MTRLSPSTIYKPSPTGYAQKLASEKLRARIDQTAQRALEVPDAEVEAAIDEGLVAVLNEGYVRHRFSNERSSTRSNSVLVNYADRFQASTRR